MSFFALPYIRLGFVRVAGFHQPCKVSPIEAMWPMNLAIDMMDDYTGTRGLKMNLYSHR